MRQVLAELRRGERVARKVFARVHAQWATSLDDLEQLSAEVRRILAREVQLPGHRRRRTPARRRRLRQVSVPPS
jgi:hypothetical protein